jgi:hypothetical protein
MKSFEFHRFIHNGIWYDFKAAKLNDTITRMPTKLANILNSYFSFVRSRNFPEYLFNDPDILRCSKFRVKKISRGAPKIISEKLIRDKTVIVVDEKTNSSQVSKNIQSLVTLTQEKFISFNSDHLKVGGKIKKPSHDAILTNIFLKHENSIAIETPIWTTKQTTLMDYMNLEKFSLSCTAPFTGHIDLMIYDDIDKSIVITDYKPEGAFLRSLPQVATYGLVIKRILKLDNVKCVSFNKDNAWLYDPEILKHEINNMISAHGNPRLIWRNLVKKL